MMKETSLIWASVTTAAGASLCCIGPLLAAGLGLGAFGAAGLFEDLRPYLLGATGLLLASAVYLRIRVTKQNGCGEVCATVRRPWSCGLGILAVVALATAPLITSALPGGGTAVLAAEAGQGQRVVVFQLEGMTCAACASGLQATLGREKGVVRAVVNYEKKSATIRFDEGKTVEAKLIAMIGEAGYVAKVVAGK